MLKTRNPKDFLQATNSPNGAFGLRKPLIRKDRLNDFGEDANQCLMRRTNSTGDEVCFNRKDIGSQLAPRRRSRISPKPQLPPTERLHTYYPLYQGPRITITSADGTTLYAETESDSPRNAAAQSLYWALARQQSESRVETLEGHMAKILGAVGADLEIKGTNAWNNDVEVRDCEWEVQSMCAAVELTRKRRKRGVWNIGNGWWNRCVAKVFG